MEGLSLRWSRSVSPLGFTRFNLVSLGFIWFQWVSFGLTWFHLVMQGKWKHVPLEIGEGKPFDAGI